MIKSRRPVNIKDLQARSKGLPVRVFDPAWPGDPYTAIVESNSNPALNQIVTIRFGHDGHIQARCTCTWAQYGGVACAHVLAALNRLAGRKRRALSFWLTPEEAQRQKQKVLRLSSAEGDIYITSRRPA
jgi:hypothetical protein